MRYPVVWDPECFTQLDALIDAGARFDELKRAIRQIDEELSLEPKVKGKPLSEGLRKLNLAPLRVYFHVDDQNATVVVDAIGWIGPNR